MRSKDPDAASVEPPPFEPGWATPATDAGYRSLRRLPDDVGGYLARGRDGDPVLVEVIGADDGAEQSRLARALAALDRLEHPHVQRVVDLGDGSGASIVLVTSPAPVRTLAGLLARRRRLAAGEVVTLLAPLGSALRHCHDRGVVHGAIAAMSIGLTEQGLPFLAGFESAVLVDGRRDRRGLIADDVAAFAELAERCWPTTAGAGWREADGLEGIERMLFDLADPEPIRADDPLGAGGPAPDLRTVLAADSPPSARRVGPTPDQPRSRLRRTHRGDQDPIRIARLLRLMYRRRGPLVVGLSVAVAAAVALTALPTTGSGGATAAAPAASAEPATAPTAAVAAPVPAAAEPVTAPTATAAVATSPAEPTPEPTPATDAAEIDARGAAAALVAGLSECSDDACAAPFLTTDSPLRAANPQAWAGFAAADPATITVTDRNGDAAVVGFAADPSAPTATASALMVRTEAGWLLRDVFAAG